MLAEAILEKIKEAGFEVAYEKELSLTKEQAGEFYKEHKDKDFFDSLTTHMSRYIHVQLCDMLPFLILDMCTVLERGMYFVPVVVPC